MVETPKLSVYFAAVAILASLLSLAGCGSTKVYTADKTLVYKDNLYNLAQVQQIGSRVDLALPSGELVESNNMDKSRMKSLLKEHDSLTLTTLILLDEREVIYERVSIDSYSDYTKHIKRLDSGKKKLVNFMSDPKTTQLKL